MSKIIRADFNGTEVQFNDAGFFNATSAAEKFGKRVDHWLANKETSEYIERLNTRISGDLILTKRGRNGGTWLHPKLGVVFARWLDVDFSIWCDEQIDNIIHGEPGQTDWRALRHEAASSYKVMSAMLDTKRQLDGKETKPHHYANEAKLVNWAITGEFKSLDRNSLNAGDLDLLAKLETMNTLLIGQGFDRGSRKVKLQSVASMHSGLHIQDVHVDKK